MWFIGGYYPSHYVFIFLQLVRWWHKLPLMIRFLRSCIVVIVVIIWIMTPMACYMRMRCVPSRNWLPQLCIIIIVWLICAAKASSYHCTQYKQTLSVLPAECSQSDSIFVLFNFVGSRFYLLLLEMKIENTIVNIKKKKKHKLFIPLDIVPNHHILMMLFCRFHHYRNLLFLFLNLSIPVAY